MLEVHEISKSFGDIQALNGVSFTVAGGEVVSILGPSGCGKSTLLQIIAGLLAPDAGEVFWQGESLAAVPPHRRNFGLMFQDYALFPHRDVFGNVAFGLSMQGMARAELRERVRRALARVGLAGYEQRDANTLSGGEQQRVALARALAPAPRLLMLDEPLGALDRTLREQLMLELQELLDALGQTALYVTHDQQEAFAVADRTIVMRAGCIEQIGSPQAIYSQPASAFVARFLGLNNILRGALEQVDGRVGVRLPFGWRPLACLPDGLPPSGSVTVLLRPDAAELAAAGPGMLAGTVASVSFRGSVYHLRLQLEAGPSLSFEMPASRPLPAVGAQVHLALGSGAVLWLPDDSG